MYLVGHIYTAVYGQRQCSNFAATLQQLCRAFVPVKRIDAGHIQIGQPLVLNQQKQESLTCFIRFYLTVEDLISMAEGFFLRDQEKIRAARLLEEKRRQREREWALEEKRKREEELRRRREALQREREEAYRRVQEEEREKQEKERAAIEALLDQQETVATDAEGRRWVRCEICGRAATDDAFSTYGGRGRANLGICRDCRDKIPPEKMRRPDISPGKRMAGDGTCPLCGRPLVKRKGRFGIFYGCSGYPACRFTKKA